MMESQLSQIIGVLEKAYGDSVPVKKTTSYCWGWFSRTTTRAWLWIEDQGDCWNLTLANGKTSHNPLYSRSYSVDIDKITGFLKSGPNWTGAFKTVLSVWPIRDAEEAQQAFLLVTDKVREAYQHLVNQKPGKT